MASETKKETKALEEYHFPGNGEYKPVTIKAENLEEATKEWEKVKKTS